MKLKFTILGCTSSFGVPYPGNDWGVCDPHEPKNRRTRCSLLIQSETTTLIVDTGADFREQMNRYNIKNLDAVFYTHKHADHTAGIDDLRIYAVRNKEKLTAYMNEETSLEVLRNKSYIFKQEHASHPAILSPYILQPFETVEVGDIAVQTHVLDHAVLNAVGYRFGNTAYSVDMKDIAEEKSFDALEGIDTWIVDAGAYHRTSFSLHATFDKIIELNKRIGAQRVILTSLSNHIDYKVASQEIPEGFEIAYDGLCVESVS